MGRVLVLLDRRCRSSSRPRRQSVVVACRNGAVPAARSSSATIPTPPGQHRGIDGRGRSRRRLCRPRRPRRGVVRPGTVAQGRERPFRFARRTATPWRSSTWARSSFRKGDPVVEGRPVCDHRDERLSQPWDEPYVVLQHPSHRRRARLRRSSHSASAQSGGPTPSHRQPDGAPGSSQPPAVAPAPSGLDAAPFPPTGTNLLSRRPPQPAQPAQPAEPSQPAPAAPDPDPDEHAHIGSSGCSTGYSAGPRRRLGRKPVAIGPCAALASSCIRGRGWDPTRQRRGARPRDE